MYARAMNLRYLAAFAPLALLVACRSNDAGSSSTASSATPAASSATATTPAPSASPAHAATPPSAHASGSAAASATPPEVAERAAAKVDVDGVSETWRLVWRSAPKPSCTDKTWNTCLCGRLAYGETGLMDLVRSRPGSPDERLDVSRLFADIGEMTIPHWPTQSGDPETVDLEAVKKRPAVDVMKIGDYDHDGRATEFVLQLSSGNPCGQSPSIVVGISKTWPQLHVFGTADHANGHLVLAHFEDWEKVRASKGPTTLVETACGDHGSEEETSLLVTPTPAGLRTKEQKRACAK